jgi:hypothetical protein
MTLQPGLLHIPPLPSQGGLKPQDVACTQWGQMILEGRWPVYGKGRKGPEWTERMAYTDREFEQPNQFMPDRTDPITKAGS